MGSRDKWRPASGEAPFFFDSLTKSHIHQYTRQDGTLVREHDNKVIKHPDLVAHERRHGEEVSPGNKLAHHAELLQHLTDSGWQKREQSAIKRNKDLPEGKAKDRPDFESNLYPETERNKTNDARKTSNTKIKAMHTATGGDDPVAHLKAFKTSRSNLYTQAEDDYRTKLLKHFGHEADDSEQHTVMEKNGHQVILGKDGTVEAAGGDPDRKIKGAVDLTERKKEQFSSGKKAAPTFVFGHKANAITHTLGKYPVQYALVDGDSLTTSHSAEGAENTDYPSELQPRDRSSVASRMQIVKLANKLEPELFGKNPLASDGSPIVGKDGMVESGNGRSLAIKMAYETNPDKAKEYKDWITENAQQEFGIDPAAAEGMKMPMIVRVREPQEGVNRANFAHEANVPMQKKESPTQQAVVDGGRIDDALLAKFNPNEDGEFDVEAQSSLPFIQGFFAKIGRNEADGLVDENGTPNKQCAERIQSAIFAKIYQDLPLIKQMAESANSGMKRIIGGLNNAVGHFAKLHGNDEFNVIPDMTEAIRNVIRARNGNSTISQMFQQSDMGLGGDGTDRNQQGFATDYGKEFALAIEKHVGSADKLGTMLGSIAQAIHNEIVNRTKEVDQEDFFATPYQPKDKKQVVTGAFAKLKSSDNAEKSVRYLTQLIKSGGTYGRRTEAERTLREETQHPHGRHSYLRKADGAPGCCQRPDTRTGTCSSGETCTGQDYYPKTQDRSTKEQGAGPRSIAGRILTKLGLKKALVHEFYRNIPSGAVTLVRQHEDSRVRSYGNKLAHANNHYDLHKLRHYRFEHLPHWNKLDEPTRQKVVEAEAQVHAYLTDKAQIEDGLSARTRARQKAELAAGRHIDTKELAASGLTEKPDRAGWAQGSLFRSLRLPDPRRKETPR
jgi:hypothetical protein